MTGSQILKTYVQPLIWPKPKAMPAILERLRNRDRSAISDCIRTYGDRVWSLSRKFTRSTQEAESAAEAIFRDIWIYSETEHGDPDRDEALVITQIAIRRLLKTMWKGRDISQ